MQFKEWLIGLGKSPKTASNYSQAIYGSIAEWAEKSSEITNSLHDIESSEEFLVFSEKIQKLPKFLERDEKGNGMYRAALKNYATYLADVTKDHLELDLERIELDASLPITEKPAFRNARVGQGKYRKALVDYWGGCAVTGLQDARFLVASHIKPWRDSDYRERLDPFNGLLLVPNLDAAFGMGFISFDAGGATRISREMERPETLGIRKDMGVALHDQHQPYMDYHRKHVFEHWTD